MYIYLSLGSNLGNRPQNLREAVRQIEYYCTILQMSHVYESNPMYLPNQPTFLNMALTCKTSLSLPDILALAKSIEHAMGRTFDVNYIHNGPRIIDIDILFASHIEIPLKSEDYITLTTPTLIVPHLRLTERAFVLYPMREIQPSFIHPFAQRSIQDLADAVHDPSCHPIGDLNTLREPAAL